MGVSCRCQEGFGVVSDCLGVSCWYLECDECQSSAFLFMFRNLSYVKCLLSSNPPHARLWLPQSPATFPLVCLGHQWPVLSLQKVYFSITSSKRISPAGDPPVWETVLHRRRLSGSLLQVSRRSWRRLRLSGSLLLVP
ncbi:hypothetical protein DPMN_006868 [Dreissena polymorpha]|uniref:Uncharacterized protein n=1 Tax=Dreissena polymorpha TaxID=45954 RepID=A0A9D4MUU4_DREPO|nr:hypothetical protein DPMN_006868 [Dreissena polymorpha]